MIDQKMIGLPAGYRDALPAEAAWRRRTEKALAGLFAEAAYREVTPAAVEFFTLYERGHQSSRQRAIRFLDREDRLLALRADFTPAVARIVAGPMADDPLPLRLWYAGTVFRKEGNLRGSFRESAQVGGELIGEAGPEADTELIRLMLRGLAVAGGGKVSLHLNHAGIFRGLLRDLRLPAGAARDLQSEIDRKDVRGLADRLSQLGIPTDMQEQVRRLSRCIGPASILDDALAVVTNQESRAGISRLQEVGAALAQENVDLTFDLAEMDDLEYYTGIMFTAFLPAQNREAGKGGRYDSLLREFGREAPAIGFSISLDALKEVA